MIAIIDYGIGNLHSVEKAFLHVGAEARLTKDPAVVQDADGVVVPGVGAFGSCALGLLGSGLQPLVLDAIDSGKPLLGICVGMQLLFEESEEMGRHAGLGLLPGRVLRFPDGQLDAAGQRLKVPQIGWNQLWHDGSDPLLAGVPSGSFAYFVHRTTVRPATRRTLWQALTMAWIMPRSCAETGLGVCNSTRRRATPWDCGCFAISSQSSRASDLFLCACGHFLFQSGDFLFLE